MEKKQILSRESQKFIDAIYNPYITQEEIIELFDSLVEKELKAERNKQREIRIDIEFFRENRPIKLREVERWV